MNNLNCEYLINFEYLNDNLNWISDITMKLVIKYLKFNLYKAEEKFKLDFGVEIEYLICNWNSN